MNAKGTRSTDYAFVTVWRVAGTADDVAEILGDPVGLARWWPSVYLQVDLIHPGRRTAWDGWPGSTPRAGSPTPSAGP
jgi:hypothetical protein